LYAKVSTFYSSSKQLYIHELVNSCKRASFIAASIHKLIHSSHVWQLHVQSSHIGLQFTSFISSTACSPPFSTASLATRPAALAAQFSSLGEACGSFSSASFRTIPRWPRQVAARCSCRLERRRSLDAGALLCTRVIFDKTSNRNNDTTNNTAPISTNDERVAGSCTTPPPPAVGAPSRL
jgi:hypothetical protein